MRKQDPEGWKKEFYPKPAASTTINTQLKATLHSLQKWRGMTPEALEKYGLTTLPISFTSTSCALCNLYLPLDSENEDECPSCPLFIVRGHVKCDAKRTDETKNPYESYRDGDPAPMIKWLEATLELVKEETY